MSVYVSVNDNDNFRKHFHIMFSTLVYMDFIRDKFENQGHRSKVKVKGGKQELTNYGAMAQAEKTQI